MLMLHEVPSQEAVSSSPARDALILLILSNYFETAYFWQSRLRCLNIERAAGGAGSGLLGDAFIPQHLSISALHSLSISVSTVYPIPGQRGVI